MSKLYKVNSAEELFEYMNKGYTFTIDRILIFFNISKTQYYDYISNNVNRIKVPIAIRRQLESEKTENEYMEFFIRYMIITNSSVLLNFDEVFSYMLIKKYLKVELFNREGQTYDDVTAEYILNDEDEGIGRTLNLLERALVNSERWQDFDDDFINRGKAAATSYKTKQSRFYYEIKKKEHFRFRILGVYCYAVIEDIDKNVPEYLMIKRDSFKFIKKFRVT